MRFLLLILLVVTLVWLARRAVRPAPPRPTAAGAPPHELMLTCAQCGVHLPRSEALPGRGGVFCGAAHRTTYEQAHPTP